jgi:outer membrane protein
MSLHGFFSGPWRAASHWAPLAAAAAVIAAPPAASAQRAIELSLPEAIGLARENNPAFLQQRNDVDVSAAAVRAAYGGLLPSAHVSSSFGYTAPGELRFQTRTFGQEPASYSSSYSIGLSYQLDGRTLLEPTVQRAQRAAAEERVTGAGANLESAVTQQYLAVLRAREQLQQARGEVGRADEYLRLAQARLDVGAGTPLEVRSASVQKGRAEIAVVQAANAAANAVLMLGTLIGMPVDSSLVLTSRFQIFEPDWNVADLIEIALDDNPLLRAVRAGASAARTSVRAARSSYLPLLDFGLGWRGYVSRYGSIDPLVNRALAGIDLRECQRNNRLLELIDEPPRPCLDPEDPAVQSNIRREIEAGNRGFPFDFDDQPFQASVTVSLPLFTGFNRGLQVAQARAQAADLSYEVRAEELRVRQEVASAARNVEAAYRTALLQEQVRENAAEELRLSQERFRFGAASSVEVTDAQTDLAQAEREQIAAVYDFHRWLAALEALVGRRLRP